MSNMSSFYGGPNGQSFYISTIFGNKQSLEEDLAKGWESSVYVGEFVIISYGRAGSTTYDSNLAIDGENWNSTLWQKVYNETFSQKDIVQPALQIGTSDPIEYRDATAVPMTNSNGFAYKWIGHLVGNTPALSIGAPNRDDLPAEPKILVLDADEKPNAWVDATNVDQPILYMALPQSQVLQLKKFTFLDANSEPNVNIDNETDINKPGLIIELPRAKGVSVNPVVDELNNNQSPEIDLSASTVNETIVKFRLPQAKKIEIDDQVEVLDADKSPVIDSTGSDDNTNRIKFQLPQSQRIKAVQIEEIDNDGIPSAELIINQEGYSVNEPLLKLKLPCVQQFIAENITSTPVGANVKPSVAFDSNGNEPKITFSLPISQIFEVNDIVNILGPQGSPNVTLSYDDADTEQNYPILTFDLPRAVKFYYGTNVAGAGTVDAAYSDFSGYEVGDYYINSDTGELYVVETVDKDNDAISFNYQACLQAPIPSPSVVGVSPYSDTLGTLTNPTVQSKIDANGKVVWEFSIPKAPNVTAAVTPLSATQWAQMGVKRTINADGSVHFEFSIPKGTQLTAGNNIPTSGTNMQIGDLYLHLPTGVMYEWDGTVWGAKPNSLKGPVGDALKIIANFDDTSTPPVPNIENDDNADIGATYIKGQITGPYKQDELFALTYNNISYWYYCVDPVNDKWSRVQLTGNISGAIKEIYTTDAGKIYSAQYINSLINNDANLKDRTTYPKQTIDEKNSWGSWDVNGNLKDSNGNLIT